MALGKLKRRSGDLDVEIDMVPIMNMFLVLIPFLLMSSSFLHLKAINTSVPVRANTPAVSDPAPLEEEIKLTAVVELDLLGMKLTVTSEQLTAEQRQALERQYPKQSDDSYPLQALSDALYRLKQRYPKSDTVIIMPSRRVRYEQIIQTMDAARKRQEQPLFEHVVLSGKRG